MDATALPMEKGVSVSDRSAFRRLHGLVVPFSLLFLWELVVRLGWVPPQLLAAPSQVVTRFVAMLLSGDLFVHAGISLYRLFAGFFLGASVGFFVGSAVGLSRSSERIFAPTLRFLSPVPPVAWIPVLIIAFGIGDLSKILLIAVGVFFIVFFHTVQGIRSTPTDLVDVGRVYEKTWPEIAMTILVPSSLPSVFSGLRVAMALCWILLIAAEVIASSKGLGWLIWDARNFSRPDDMFVGVASVGIFGKLTDNALALLQARATRWQSMFGGA